MKLYQYHHCPYCVRADMVANYKNVPHEKVYLLNDDEQSCFDLVDAKVVPILQFDDGTAMKESLDIVHKLDELGDSQKLLSPSVTSAEFDELFADIKGDMRIVTYPRTISIGLPEFATQSARDYFQHKKEKMIGMSFEQASAQSEQHLEPINQVLAKLSTPELNDTLSIDDVTLFPTLRNLSMVKGLKFKQDTLAYMQHVANITASELYFNRAI